MTETGELPAARAEAEGIEAAGDKPAVARPPWPTFAYDADAGPGYRAAIGVVTLSNDYSIEPELVRFLPRDGVALYANRIHFPETTTVATLAAMEQDIRATAALINPGVKLDVIAFGCTSGTMAIGQQTVAERILEARPDVSTTDPITAALTGLTALGCRRIAILTPYIDEINAMVAEFVESRGFEVVAGGGFKIREAVDLCRVSPQSVRTAALQLGTADIDGIFISCTGLRVSSIVKDLETELGMPVVASNQAIAWHALRLAGCQDRRPEYGRLMTLDLPR